MSHRHLIDTDIAIELLRKRSPEVRERWRAAGRVAASTVTYYELRYGAARSRDRAANDLAIDELASVVDFVEFDGAAADHAGDIRAALAAAGTPIGPYDLQIAGQARASGLILVTRNVTEFARVDGLRIETW